MKKTELKLSGILFNQDKQTFTITLGDIGEYQVQDVKKVHVVYEDAQFYGKSAPFSHKMLISRMEPLFAGMKQVYIGLEFTMKDNKKCYAYLSDKKLQQYADDFNKLTEAANNLIKEFTIH